MLELKKVSKSYRASGNQPLQPVLKGVNLTVGAGERLAIMGPSGCGKSTLLNMIGCLDRPDSGEIVLEGHNLTGLSELERARVRYQSIGFVFQMHHLLPQCSVLENVLLPALAGGGKIAPDTYQRACQLLERVGMAPFRDKRPGEMSGGQCQRTAFVRALINRPRLLLADEPTGSLDEENGRALLELLLEMNREEGTALIVVTHAPDLAGRLGRIYRMSDGVLTGGGGAA